MHFFRAALPLLVAPALAWEPGHVRNGLVGFSFELYGIACASACQGVFRKTPIFCTDASSFKSSSGSGHGNGNLAHDEELPANYTLTASKKCLSQSRNFLTSEAYCVQQKCTNLTTWDLEEWWQFYVVGNLPSDPRPSLTYGAALALITNTPTSTCSGGRIMNGTCKPDDKLYNSRFLAISEYNRSGNQHEHLGMVVFLTSVGLPVVFSLLRFFPFPFSKRWLSLLNSYFIYPSLLRPWRNSPVSTVLGDPPTRGQALFIGYLILINIIMSIFTYNTNPNALGFFGWTSTSTQVMSALGNRLGVLSFANFGVLVLFSSRNNILLWLTDWQHSTFVILHRWVARIAVLQAILHSVIFLRDYIEANLLATDQTTPYWYWGCVGTIAASLMLPLSLPVFRRRAYEVFLATHIVFSILVFLGSWYHIYCKYGHQSGYETWLYIVFAIWGFDRVVRSMRMLWYGVHTAVITHIDHEYIKVSIKGAVADGHVYLYFLHSRFWENHPFSVASSTVQVQADGISTERRSNGSESPTDHEQKALDSTAKPVTTSSNDSTLQPGMEFYLRVRDGATKALHLQCQSEVKVLIEGSYGRHEILSEFPTLLCIAGGVGITACLPYLRAFPGNATLHWGSRSQALVDSLTSFSKFPAINIDAVVGKRLDLISILGNQQGDFAVVVSGPPEMVDEVRKIVSKLARKKRIKLVTESFYW